MNHASQCPEDTLRMNLTQIWITIVTKLYPKLLYSKVLLGKFLHVFLSSVQSTHLTDHISWLLIEVKREAYVLSQGLKLLNTSAFTEFQRVCRMYETETVALWLEQPLYEGCLKSKFL